MFTKVDEKVSDSCEFSIDLFEMMRAYPCEVIFVPKRSVKHIPNFQWWVEIYPRGRKPHFVKGKMQIQLCFSRPISVEYKVKLGILFNCENKVIINADDLSLLPQTPTFISVPDFDWEPHTRHIYDLPNRALKLEFDMKFDRPITEPLPILSTGILSDLSKVELVVGNERVETSKSLLMQMSPVFNAMFTHDTKEATTNCIEIDDFDFSTVHAFAEYCNGHVSDKLSPDIVVELLWFSEKYAIEGLVDHIEAYLLGHLTINIVLHVAKYAATHSRNKLMTACVKFYRSNFRQIKAGPEDKGIENVLFSSMLTKSVNLS